MQTSQPQKRVVNESGPREDRMKQRWWKWHRENPQVYSLFERFTFEAVERGHKKLSAWLIVNRIRWETAVVTRGGDFKISNDFIAYYSRLFMHQHPEFCGFFRTRPLRRWLADGASTERQEK